MYDACYLSNTAICVVKLVRTTKVTVFWDVAIIALMMEAAITSEMLVNFYQTTWCNSPEDSHLHTRRRENLKSHLAYLLFIVYSLRVRS
jgi:hypothetical protein